MNPRDTDDGRHPQNLFRMLTRERWRELRQEVFFSVRDTNTTSSPNRDAWSGIFLYTRYADPANTYYAGLRVDGAAVIKKKRHGRYHTLGSGQVFGSRGEYDRTSRPNLLPRYDWIGIRSEIVDLASGDAVLRLYVADGFDGAWQLVVETTDTLGGADGPPLTGYGRAGIRSDFMDLSFDRFTALALR